MPEWMDWFPVAGWRSVDEQGRLPPGQKPLVRLPPGVTPAISPEDKERRLLQADIVTVPRSFEDYPDPWVSVVQKKNDLLWYCFERIPDKMRQAYNSMSLFDTEAMYHIRMKDVTPIWECDLTDTLCAYNADRRAVAERRVEHSMVKVIAARLQACHRNVAHMEACQLEKNFAYDVQCGPLEETLREMEASFELKWGQIGSINPTMNLGRRAYYKQKNRYIEDRFRHRMMANVGAQPNVTDVSEEGRWTIDGVDERNYTPWRTLSLDGHCGMNNWDFPDPRKWDLNDALLKEAQKRQKLAAEE